MMDNCWQDHLCYIALLLLEASSIYATKDVRTIGAVHTYRGSLMPKDFNMFGCGTHCTLLSNPDVLKVVAVLIVESFQTGVWIPCCFSQLQLSFVTCFAHSSCAW